MAKTFEEDVQSLENILSNWEIDSRFDATTPNDNIKKNQDNHTKYLKILARNKINLIRADDEYKEMRGKRIAYYEGALSKQELDALGWDQYLGKSPKISAQLENLLSSDPFLMEIVKRKKAYETIIEATEYIMKEINSRHFSIKAFIDWEIRIRSA